MAIQLNHSRHFMNLQRALLSGLLLGAFDTAMCMSRENANMIEPQPILGPALPVEGQLPSLDRVTSWLNSSPLSAKRLRGKVVLVDFWTYTCINWRRTLPFLRTWNQRYGEAGLVIIGVHTPEFQFEKDVGNVRIAINSQDIKYPVAIDNDFAIWNQFGNRYWPAVYIVDSRGQIRHHHFGEGNYGKLELILRQLLSETGAVLPPISTSATTAPGAEAPADWENLRSPETYLGYARSDSFASPERLSPERSQTYSVPVHIKLNEWAFSGDWTAKQEFSVARRPNGKIAMRFHARDVHMVMKATPGKAIRYRVTIDGQAPGRSHGADTDIDGLGTVEEARMYQLIRQMEPVVDRLVEVEFLEAGVEIFALTFG